MVTQNMLRTHEGKYVVWKKKNLDFFALYLFNCPKQIK